MCQKITGSVRLLSDPQSSVSGPVQAHGPWLLFSSPEPGPGLVPDLICHLMHTGVTPDCPLMFHEQNLNEASRRCHENVVVVVVVVVICPSGRRWRQI